MRSTKKNPVSVEMARNIGADAAAEWLNRQSPTFGPVEAYRAINHAWFTCDIQKQRDFIPVLHAWEQGFDETIPPANPVQTMQPLPEQTGRIPVLHIDLSAGYAAIAEEAEQRLVMLRAITSIISTSHSESSDSHDTANLCAAFHRLIGEAAGLYEASYSLLRASLTGKGGAA